MLAGLEQYAAGLRGRPELIWPKPPATEPIKARAGSLGLKGVRCVLWGTYGTVLQVVSGDLLFEHPKDFVTTLALEKTISLKKKESGIIFVFLFLEVDDESQEFVFTRTFLFLYQLIIMWVHMMRQQLSVRK